MSYLLKFAIAALFLTGCASTPTFQNHESSNAACISGDTANIFRFFTHGEAHVRIREIDGTPTSGFGPFCVAPGKRRFGVFAGASGYQQAQNYVDLELEPGKSYVLRGNLKGISILISLFDVSQTPEQKLGEFSLLAGTAAQPGPIIIPSRR